MTVYDPILDAETDPDQPLKSSLAKRWSSNWIAGFEGAAGAPRIVGLAAKRFIDYPVITVSAADTVQCDVLFSSQTDARSFQTGSSWAEGWSGTVGKGTGSMRFKWTAIGGGSGSGQTRIKLNGTVVNTFSGTGSKTQDITVVPGDVVSVEAIRTSGTGGDTFGYNSLAIWASDTYETRPLWLKNSEQSTP